MSKLPVSLQPTSPLSSLLSSPPHRSAFLQPLIILALRPCSLVNLFFQPKQCFSLKTNQSEQCFGLFFQRSERGLRVRLDAGRISPNLWLAIKSRTLISFVTQVWQPQENVVQKQPQIVASNFSATCAARHNSPHLGRGYRWPLTKHQSQLNLCKKNLLMVYNHEGNKLTKT